MYNFLKRDMALTTLYHNHTRFVIVITNSPNQLGISKNQNSINQPYIRIDQC